MATWVRMFLGGDMFGSHDLVHGEFDAVRAALARPGKLMARQPLMSAGGNLVMGRSAEIEELRIQILAAPQFFSLHH